MRTNSNDGKNVKTERNCMDLHIWTYFLFITICPVYFLALIALRMVINCDSNWCMIDTISPHTHTDEERCHLHVSFLLILHLLLMRFVTSIIWFDILEYVCDVMWYAMMWCVDHTYNTYSSAIVIIYEWYICFFFHQCLKKSIYFNCVCMTHSGSKRCHQMVKVGLYHNTPAEKSIRNRKSRD